ncbi:unnamed protein product [Paramecium primaurelia]|uniref:Transmembrane protein n=1 Tax=Paramecium primaurelia TaxID=5886 RepID=A0A8S1KK93_PARPR|nr:unnamed protein product [Paramecium primaurelia]
MKQIKFCQVIWIQFQRHLNQIGFLILCYMFNFVIIQLYLLIRIMIIFYNYLEKLCQDQKTQILLILYFSMIKIQLILCICILKIKDRSNQDHNKKYIKVNFNQQKLFLKKFQMICNMKMKILYFFEEIAEIIKISRKMKYKEFEKEFQDIFNEKIQGIINSSTSFKKIMNFVHCIEKIQQRDQASIILEALLQKLFSQNLQKLEENENALNIIIEKFYYDESFRQQVKQKINNQVNNPYFEVLFRDFLNNFALQQYRGYFEQELIKLQFKFGLKLYDLQLTNKIECPEILIMNISQEFIRNVIQSDDTFKLKMKIILSNLLDQCQNLQDEKLDNRKNIIRLLIRRL